jgi:GAGA factor
LVEKIFFRVEKLRSHSEPPPRQKSKLNLKKKIKREPSIEIETVEIDMSDDTKMSDESEVNDTMNADAVVKIESLEMFAVQAITKSSSKLKIQKTSQAKQQSLQCPICNKIISNKDNLRRHIATVHEKKTRFTCPHCPKASYSNQNLQRHNRTRSPTTTQRRHNELTSTTAECSSRPEKI